MKQFKLAILTTASLGVIAGLIPTIPAYAANDQAQIAASADSGTMQRADKDMAKVFTALQNLGPKPIETLTPEEARKQPTMTDAVMAVLKEKGKNPEELKAKMGVTTKDITYPAASGEQKARVYMPEEKSDKALPVIVYYHGGGWVLADLDVYDAAPRALSKKAKAIVVSIEYRHAPESKFPAAHEDAFAAYQWVLKNAGSWGGDSANVAVAGESAGGNLAANVAIMARDKGVQMPVHMALIYPVAGTDMNTESYQRNADAKPLNKAMMGWFMKQILAKDSDKSSRMLDLVHADLKNLPSATVITAEIDPLMTEGKMLADALSGAGSKVDYKNYEGVTHEFFGADAAISDAADAQDRTAKNLHAAFKDHEQKASQ
jgi:acetyl esterase/lipase